MRTGYKLTERGWARWADPIDAYFRERVLGPELGLDPDYSGERAGKWDAYTTYDASMNYRATDALQLSPMVNNLTNEMPDDQASSFPGTGSTPYNNYFYNPDGRAVHMEVKYAFGK